MDQKWPVHGLRGGDACNRRNMRSTVAARRPERSTPPARRPDGPRERRPPSNDDDAGAAGVVLAHPRDPLRGRLELRAAGQRVGAAPGKREGLRAAVVDDCVAEAPAELVLAQLELEPEQALEHAPGQA